MGDVLSGTKQCTDPGRCVLLQGPTLRDAYHRECQLALCAGGSFTVSSMVSMDNTALTFDW